MNTFKEIEQHMVMHSECVINLGDFNKSAPPVLFHIQVKSLCLYLQNLGCQFLFSSCFENQIKVRVKENVENFENASSLSFH